MNASQFILPLYGLTLAGLAWFAAHRIKMLWLYLRTARQPLPEIVPWRGETPLVCLQCPLYNEPLVVEALLEKVAALRWAEGKLEIQMLDDSNDETSAIIERWLKQNPAAARRIHHIRRPNRVGYKAGALNHGMSLTKAEFFPVLDADFQPAPDFLEKLMPYFGDEKVGVVQARWEFSNRRASLLTRFQGVFLDAHFIVEQAARFRSGLFFNFNGTAGIWRRRALEEAGGWTADTVTEDLDASYRAQSRGWKFVYLADYAVPSELPENLTAFKSQQHRWTKGGIQVARKQLRSLMTADLPWRVRREAWSHLTVGFVHPLLVTFSLLFVPYLYLLGDDSLVGIWRVLNPVSVLLTGGATVAFYITGQYFRERQWREGCLWLLSSPLLLAFGLAMSVNGAVAVIEGMFARGGEFVRTPKGGRAVVASGLVKRLSKRAHFTAITAIELGLGALMLVGAFYFGRNEMLWLALTLVIKSSGFLGMVVLSTRDLLPRFGWARG